jgi:hypothetical protein
MERYDYSANESPWQIEKGLYSMSFEKLKVSAICAVCGASLAWNGAHPNIECKPRIEMCEPPVMHMPDGPHKEPKPMNTSDRVLRIAVASASATLSLGPIHFGPPKT